MRDLQYATEAHAEEQDISDREQRRAELVPARAGENRVQHRLHAAGQVEAAGEPVGDFGRVVVDVAHHHHAGRDGGDEEVGGHEHNQKAAVGLAEAAIPADRGALARGGILPLHPLPAAFGDAATSCPRTPSDALHASPLADPIGGAGGSCRLRLHHPLAVSLFMKSSTSS